jgi:hypothetical protein
MLYGTEDAVCSETDTKRTQCGQNLLFVRVKPVGARNKWALKGSYRRR